MSDTPNQSPDSALRAPRSALFQLVSDGDGAPSTLRVAVLLVIAPVMIVWSVLSIKRGEFIPLDWNLIGLIGSALGAKAVQSFAENKSQPPTP